MLSILHCHQLIIYVVNSLSKIWMSTSTRNTTNRSVCGNLIAYSWLTDEQSIGYLVGFVTGDEE
jgi:hypothetical protein